MAASEKESRYIFLSGTISEEKVRTVVDSIIGLNIKNSTDPILMVIDTYGGYVDSLWGIIDAMNLSTAPIYTLCVGKAMSAGFMILLSGKKGHRYITPHSRLMMHEMSTGNIGRAHQLKVSHEENVRIQKELEQWVVKHTKMDSDFVKKKMKIDFFMDAEEAKGYGVIDKIVKNFSEIPLKIWK